MHKKLNKWLTKDMSLEERLFASIDKKDGCWIWTGSLTGRSLPQLKFKEKSIYPRSVIYKLQKNENPPEVTITTCGNSKCVNPDHVTDRKNSLKSRFDNGYKINEKTGCWEWIKTMHSKNGYGSIGVGTSNSEKAHKISYILHKGEIPIGLCVCHTCDNPKCVNPNHLWLGTPKDNSDDKFKKNRFVSCKGESNGGCKITEEIAKKIKEMLLIGKTSMEISRFFNINYKTVFHIKHGHTWKHI